MTEPEPDAHSETEDLAGDLSDEALDRAAGAAPSLPSFSTGASA